MPPGTRNVLNQPAIDCFIEANNICKNHRPVEDEFFFASNNALNALRACNDFVCIHIHVHHDELSSLLVTNIILLFFDLLDWN